PAARGAPTGPDFPSPPPGWVGGGDRPGGGGFPPRARVGHGDSVVVIGTGGIGLNVIQGARIAAARRIVAIDANPAKEAVARQFGATDFIDASQVADPVEAVRALLPNGADHAFECVGHVRLVRQAIDLLDRRGQAVLLGVPPADAEASFRVSAMYLDKSILGCRYGSSRPQRDIALYAELYRQRCLLLDELVTKTYPIEDFAKAADDAHHGRVARGVLTF
ncbi:zinc-binding dehydrogenase, partial [Streptomyces sp. NPDC054933]